MPDNAVEQSNHIEESGCDVLPNDDRRMLVLRILLALNIPVLNSSDQVRFIRRAELRLFYEDGVKYRKGS